MNTYNAHLAPLTFRPPRVWFVIRPDGTYWVVWPRDIDRLRTKAKARKATGGGGDGGSIA